MNDALQSLLVPAGIDATLYPPTSRYHGVATTTLQTPDGLTTVYLRRRFVPQPQSLAVIREHQVRQGDRLDNLSAEFLGDPELFWQICDANLALRPAELTEIVGRILRITLPAGIPGSSA